jgi:membrane-associated HD superfamily phosphohydrolase
MDESQNSASKAAPAEQHRGEGFWAMFADAFRGPTCWLAVLGLFWSLAFTALAVWSAVMFFRVQSTRDLILYAALFLAAVNFIVLMKIWYWLLITRNMLLRRIDRLCR